MFKRGRKEKTPADFALFRATVVLGAQFGAPRVHGNSTTFTIMDHGIPPPTMDLKLPEKKQAEARKQRARIADRDAKHRLWTQFRLQQILDPFYASLALS